MFQCVQQTLRQSYSGGSFLFAQLLSDRFLSLQYKAPHQRSTVDQKKGFRANNYAAVLHPNSC